MLSVAFMGTLSALIIAVIFCIINIGDIIKYIIGYAVIFVVFLGIVYLSMPSKSLPHLLMLNIITGIIYMVISMPIGEDVSLKLPFGVTAGVFLAILAGILGFGMFQTHYDVKPIYNSLNVKVEKKAPLLDKNETPIAIAPKTVRNKMNKAMSIVPNTSYYRLGDLQTQIYHGKVVYIAPVEFDGFWKWHRAKVTPGYFIIDATNVNAEPHFVKKDMRYTPSGYLQDDAQRKIYSKYPNWTQSGDAQLEVDDNGTPYYIQTVYKTKGVMSRINYKTLHVVILNTITGKSSIYKTQDAPKFVDEAIDSETATYMNKVYGKYGHGYWNSVGSKRDVKVPNSNGTENGVTPVADKNGDIWYFNDFTSPKNDADSTMGYSMINARTGKMIYYTGKNVGVMDSVGAKNLADMAYIQQRWHAAMPIMYNIDGTPTWVVSLLDSTGAFRSYAYIKAGDQSVKAYAGNASDALDQYRVQLASSGSSAGSTGNSTAKKVAGTVSRLAVVSNNSSQNIIFTLDKNNTLFTVQSDDFPKAVLLKVGDEVELTATINNSSKTGNVKTFTNKTFD